MTETNVQSLNNLPYRARIMMSANVDGGVISKNNLLSGKFSNVHNMKPLNARKEMKSAHHNAMSATPNYADLQPLQWLHQDAILSIAPLDNEDEYVPGKDDIVSVTTSPIMVDVVAEAPHNDDNAGMPSSTIADFYRYQAMRAAMAGGHTNGMRSSSQPGPTGACQQQANEYQKPPFSYTHIIFMAIETSPNKAMTVNDIYVWCETHFPYYTQAGVGWKNSLRHNLSINKSFKKISRDGRGGPGRGAYWIVEPRERNNLVDAIRRSPCSLGSLPFLSTVAGPSQACLAAAAATTIISAAAAAAASASTSASVMPASATRGPLLRIGGHITDASQLIRSSPVIQRLREPVTTTTVATISGSSASTIDLCSPPSMSPSGLLPPDYLQHRQQQQAVTIDDSECRGRVLLPAQLTATGAAIDPVPETEHAHFEMLRTLVASVTVGNDDNQTNGDDIRTGLCPEHGGCRRRRSGNSKSNCHDSGVIEDMLAPEELGGGGGSSGGGSKKAGSVSRSGLKKQRCNCSKYIGLATDSDDSEISYSNDEFSDMSETDFNWKMNVGRRNRHREKRSVLQQSGKGPTSSARSSSQQQSARGPRRQQHQHSSRTRINSIIRAPHSDHVYAFLQEFLLPVNMSQQQAEEPQAATVPVAPGPANLVQESAMIPVTQRRANKRKWLHGPASCRLSSDELDSGSAAAAAGPLRQQQSHRFNTKFYNHSEDNEEGDEEDDSEDDSGGDDNSSYDASLQSGDEEQENRWVKREATVAAATAIVGPPWPGSRSRRQQMAPTSVAHNSGGGLLKRRVGRPRKTEQATRPSKIAASKRLEKTADAKYLRESNYADKLSPEVSNNEEEAAIKILASLHRKTQRERISNMYRLTTSFLEPPAADMPH